jgi:hypothetical protein
LQVLGSVVFREVLVSGIKCEIQNPNVRDR